MKKFWPVYTLIIFCCIGFLILCLIQNQKNAVQPSDTTVAMDYKNGTYEIGGTNIQLTNGMSEIEVAPGLASMLVTRYFGSEHVMDLDGDGRDDVAFIVTQETGGSGVFYYAVGAIMTDVGYVGTDGYLLGDRISPQSTDSSSNPRQKNVVVFNYADRKLAEAMTVSPAVGKSAYLKVVPETMRWAVVEANFEGESTQVQQEGDTHDDDTLPTERYSAQVDRVKVVFEQWDYNRFRLQTNELVREGVMNSERGFGGDEDATLYILNWDKSEGEQIRYVRLTAEPSYLYALDGYQNIIKSGRLVLSST